MGGIFPVTSLQIYNDSYVVTRYVFYGFLPKTSEFDSTCQTKLIHIDIEIEQLYSAPGSLFDLLFSVLLTQKVKIRKFTITKTDFWRQSEKVFMKLSEKELGLISTYLQPTNESISYN